MNDSSRKKKEKRKSFSHVGFVFHSLKCRSFVSFSPLSNLYLIYTSLFLYHITHEDPLCHPLQPAFVSFSPLSNLYLIYTSLFLYHITHEDPLCHPLQPAFVSFSPDSSSSLFLHSHILSSYPPLGFCYIPALPFVCFITHYLFCLILPRLFCLIYLQSFIYPIFPTYRSIVSFPHDCLPFVSFPSTKNPLSYSPAVQCQCRIFCNYSFVISFSPTASFTSLTCCRSFISFRISLKLSHFTSLMYLSRSFIWFYSKCLVSFSNYRFIALVSLRPGYCLIFSQLLFISFNSFLSFLTAGSLSYCS